MTDARQTLPLSPVLLAGMAMRPLPLALVQPAASFAMTALHRRHPAAFERLRPLGDAAFLIDPVDLPFAFVLQPGARPPAIRAVRAADGAGEVAAVVAGPLGDLIDLLEGRADGDALFFSRGLSVSGDTEAVLALRNAVDDAEIDLLEVLASALGPLSEPARRLSGPARALGAAMARDVERLHAALLAPAKAHAAAHGAALRDLDERLSALERRHARLDARRPSSGRPAAREAS